MESDDSGDQALLALSLSPMSPNKAAAPRRARAKASTAFDNGSPDKPLGQRVYNGGLDLFSAMKNLQPTPVSPVASASPPVSPVQATPSPVKLKTPVRKRRARTPKSRVFSQSEPEAASSSPIPPLKKASSVFDSAEFLASERRALVEGRGEAGNSVTEKNAKKKYERFFKKLQEPEVKRLPGSPASKGRRRARVKGGEDARRQPSVASFFQRPALSESDEEMTPTLSQDTESDDGLPTIDELLKNLNDEKREDPVQVQKFLAAARQDILRSEELEREHQIANEEKEQADQLAKIRQTEIDMENIAYRDRLDRELDEDRTRKIIRDNFGYLQDVWDGKVESRRYQIFHKGGPAAHALMYQMITDPFSDRHLDWIMAEIQKKWMPNERLHAVHNDFVWKVILAEALIKIYSDMFNLSKEEAEHRINQTPLRPEHCNSDFLT